MEGMIKQQYGMADKSEKQNNIQSSFNSTLTDSNLQNLSIDFAELGIDSVLNDGLLREIPIVSTIASFLKIGANIHDRLFLKKVLSFLNQLKDVPAERRKQMINDIDSSQKYRIRVGEKLFYIIDSCEDYEISELIGVMFRAFVEERIIYDEFMKTTSVLRGLNISDFRWFIAERESYDFNLDNTSGMLNTGLFDIYYEDVSVTVEDQDDYKATEKYKTDVYGGVGVNLSRTGEVILEVFCPSYKKKKATRLS